MRAGGVAVALLGTIVVVQVLAGHALERLKLVPS